MTPTESLDSSATQSRPKSAEPPPRPVDLFYSYSHKDEDLRVELDGHLAILRRRGVLRTWNDRRIVPGDDWRKAIDDHLAAADIVLLLVSAHFLNSDYCHEREMGAALERHARGECTVIPVMLRHVDWEGARFAHLQGLPTDMKPVMSWNDRDEAWTNVAKGIRRTVEQLLKSRPHVVDDRPPISDSPQMRKAEERVLTALEERICQAFKANKGAPPPEAARKTYPLLGQQLVNVRAYKKILWVDDQPSNNIFEIAALRGLQIEVQIRTTTEEGLAALEEAENAREPYDLVLSDWTRLPARDPAQPEGPRLLRLMRAQNRRTPVIFYHGEFNPEKAKQRLELAVKEGGTGAANMPDDLLRQVARVLASPEAA